MSFQTIKSLSVRSRTYRVTAETQTLRSRLFLMNYLAANGRGINEGFLYNFALGAGEYDPRDRLTSLWISLTR